MANNIRVGQITLNVEVGSDITVWTTKWDRDEDDGPSFGITIRQPNSCHGADRIEIIRTFDFKTIEMDIKMRHDSRANNKIAQVKEAYKEKIYKDAYRAWKEFVASRERIMKKEEEGQVDEENNTVKEDEEGDRNDEATPNTQAGNDNGFWNSEPMPNIEQETNEEELPIDVKEKADAEANAFIDSIMAIRI